ncbi:MAG: hypothetical protein R3C60_07500 [Parvularculaceae bacterium]
MTYYIAKTSPAISTVISKSALPRALAAEGFGVLTRSTSATLKKKIDVDFRPYRNSAFAIRRSRIRRSAEDKIASCSCNVIVQQTDDEVKLPRSIRSS